MFLILGFGLLIVGSDFLVDGSASVARKFGVSNLIIGLTLVSIATSFPELIVSLDANLKGSPDLAVANILGSNISNILLILGLVSMMFHVKVKKSTLNGEMPLLLLALMLVILLANDFLSNGSRIIESEVLHLSRADGIILFSFFLVFIYYTYALLKRTIHHKTAYFRVFDEDKYSIVTQMGKFYDKVKGKQFIITIGEVNVHPASQSLLIILAGLGMLILGGNTIVDSTQSIAKVLNIPDFFLGLTIVSIGTSLPELATGITAFRKGNSDLAVGNIIGSNIFNTLFVLGTVSIFKPLTFTADFNVDLLVAFISTLFLAVLLRFRKDKVIKPYIGIFFVWFYFLYLMFKFLN